VAGNLAARHGIRVHLAPAERGQGVVAVVELPPALLADAAPGVDEGPVGGLFGPLPSRSADAFPPPPGAPAAPPLAPAGRPAPGR
jgi:hypothetical protein